MIKNQLKLKIQSEINIVPFLDILLILLVIFMMIPYQLIQGFQVNLPNSTKVTNITNNNQSILTIEIIQSGLYNIIINNQRTQFSYLKQLNSEINKKVHINPNIICLIAASKTVKYDEIIQVLNMLRIIGVRSVGMITHPVY